MKKLAVLILGIVLIVSPGYALHDVTCYDIIEPGTDYVQDRVEITPTLGVANLGEQAEEDFPVIFRSLVVEDGSTHYEDTVWVDDIGPYPDSIEVEFPPWTPESKCNEDEPWVEYDCYGITELNYDVDENPANDTAYRLVTCLWSHDVGVYDITHTDFDADPDIWFPGTEVTFTAHVENYGINAEHGITVYCEVWTYSYTPKLLFADTGCIEFIDWRGNESGNPYTAEYSFKEWTVNHDGLVKAHFWTEMDGDECPYNDFESLVPNCEPDPGVTENAINELRMVSMQGTVKFNLDNPSQVSIQVYAVNGCRVQTLVNDTYPAGTHEIKWPTDKHPAGVYFVRFEAGDYRVSEKAIILK